MNHNAIKYKDILMSIISRQKENLTCFACNPGKDFSRTRKLPYEKLILSLLTLEGASLSNELLRQFGCDCTTATSSAFVQQRKKLFVSAMENLFQTFISETDESKCFNGLRLLAVDGSDIQIPTNPADVDSLIQTSENAKPYNLLHLNALYDIISHTYVDAVINKIRGTGENKALVDMVDRSIIAGKVLVMADRGYEAYNNMAHIQEKGWKYLIRIKDFNTYSSGILHGLDLPAQEEFDVSIDLKLT